MTTMDEYIKALEEKNVELAEDEQVEYLIKRHWISLVVSIFIPAFITLFSFALFIYRAMGGTFLHVDNRFINTFDGANIVLTFFLAISGILVVVASRGKNRQLQGSMVVVTGLLGLLIFFRYQGGRVFHLEGGGELFDGLNILLAVALLAGAFFCYYVYVEWENDYLILTNQRVLYWHEVLLGKHSQDQIYIEDIQNVIANRATYLQYWLNFGSIKVTSAAYRKPLEFTNAASPQDMQKKIMDKVNSNRQQQSRADFDAIIKAKVYGESAAQKAPPPKLTPAKKVPLLDFLFYENPQIGNDGTITWRQHWIFIPLVVVRPLLFLILSFVAIFIINQIPAGTNIPFVNDAAVAEAQASAQPIINGLGMVGIILLIVTIFLVWAWYVIEDERNELYILKPNVLIDVEKDPLGPEQRNTANIGSVQNVKSNTTFLGRIIGYGDVIIETAGAGGQLTFPRLPNPNEVVTTINDYRVRFKKSEKERALNDTVTLLKHYHNLEQDRRQSSQAPSPDVQKGPESSQSSA